MNLNELIKFWDSDEGKPYKGNLIDMSRYNGNGVEPPVDLGCMCAQGQVLHLLDGWTPERLKNVEQYEADRATAKLLNISVAHAILLRHVNDTVDGAPSIVLGNPGKVLGDQWSKLLDFWWYLDQITPKQWTAVGSVPRDAARNAARNAARDATRDAARDAARGAARDGARNAARNVAWDGVWDAARNVAWDGVWDAAEYATSEIQSARLLRERGKPFYFLPMFGFADPEAIPSRPANYGTLNGH